MEHRAFLYGASADAPQDVYRPPVRREISQWGREPFGGTIEDNHFPPLVLSRACALCQHSRLTAHGLPPLPRGGSRRGAEKAAAGAVGAGDNVNRGMVAFVPTKSPCTFYKIEKRAKVHNNSSFFILHSIFFFRTFAPENPNR